MVQIETYMSSEIKDIPHDASVKEAALKMREYGIGSLLVKKGKEYSLLEPILPVRSLQQASTHNH